MHARARETQRLIGTFTSATKEVVESASASFFADTCGIPLRDPSPAASLTCAKGWIDLDSELAEMFGMLVVPELRSVTDCMHRGSAKDVGIRVRRIGRDPKKVEAYNEQRRERRRRERRRRYDSERWAELRSRPLEAVEIDGVIWMKPCAELEEHRRRSRERARGKKKAA